MTDLYATEHQRWLVVLAYEDVLDETMVEIRCGCSDVYLIEAESIREAALTAERIAIEQEEVRMMAVCVMPAREVQSDAEALASSVK